MLRAKLARRPRRERLALSVWCTGEVTSSFMNVEVEVIWKPKVTAMWPQRREQRRRRRQKEGAVMFVSALTLLVAE